MIVYRGVLWDYKGDLPPNGLFHLYKGWRGGGGSWGLASGPPQLKPPFTTPLPHLLGYPSSQQQQLC